MSSDNYPTSWKQFIDNGGKESELFSKLSKWSARFRLAKSFSSIDLGNNYQEDTIKQYSAIIKIFLTYTAFEQYCKAYNIHANQIPQQLQDCFLKPERMQKIRDLDPNNNFCKFLIKYLESNQQKQQMQNFIDQGSIDIIVLAKSTRHVFAHGSFAASSTGIPPRRFEEISQIISDSLLNCMDLDFTNRVNVL